MNTKSNNYSDGCIKFKTNQSLMLKKLLRLRSSLVSFTGRVMFPSRISFLKRELCKVPPSILNKLWAINSICGYNMIYTPRIISSNWKTNKFLDLFLFLLKGTPSSFSPDFYLNLNSFLYAKFNARKGINSVNRY